MKVSSQSQPGQSEVKPITVSARGASRVREGHPWVYRSDVLSSDGVPPGALAVVHDHRGKLLGTAFYSSASQIAVRMVADRALSSRDFVPLLRERLNAAAALRERLVQDSDACRLVFSEADLLPGLIVDRYNDVLSLQVLTQALDSDEARCAILDTLVARFSPAGVVERVEDRIRELEQLPARPTAFVLAAEIQAQFGIPIPGTMLGQTGRKS